MMLFKLIDVLTNEKVLPVIISTVTTITVFFLTLLSKDYFDTKILRSKLNAEHEFEQRKKIKEVLAKYKVNLINACDEFNHRMWNFSKKYQEGWLNVNGDYEKDNYYFHSFVYRSLAVFAWSKKIQKEMIFLDTTIASKEDLNFIKFINIFPRMFCDLTFIEGDKADGNKNDDHFYRNEFDLFADSIMTDVGIKSFSEYTDGLEDIKSKIVRLFKFFDGLNPFEDRSRWDRVHLMHLTVLVFLNNYGYDFQVTNDDKLKKVLIIPKKSQYLGNYFNLIDEYHLLDNKAVKSLKNIVDELPN